MLLEPAISMVRKSFWNLIVLVAIILFILAIIAGSGVDFKEWVK